MVVRLKDLNNDSAPTTDAPSINAPSPKKGLVRLSDLNPGQSAETANALGNASMDESRLINQSRESLLPAAPEPQPDNSRQLPIIGPVLRGLDAFGHNPIVEKAAEIGRSLYLPGGGMANIAGLTGAAESAVSRALPKLGNTLAGRVAQKGISEGIVGAPLGAGQSLMTNPDASTGDFLQNTALGSVLGGALGMGGKYAGSKIGQALENWRAARNPQVEQQAGEMLALPPGRGEQRLNAAMDRSNLSPNESPIAGQGDIYTPKPTQPLGLPEPTLLPPTQARVEVKPNEYTRKLENLFETANKQNFTPGKELEELNSLWSQMAGPKDPNLNDLIDLAYPKQTKVDAGALSRARELQQSREAAGVPSLVKSSSDRYQPFAGDAGLPRERVGLRTQPQNVEVMPPKRNFAPNESALSRPEPLNSDMQPKGIQTTPLRAQKLQGPTDELKFAQTVKESSSTPPDLLAAMNKVPMTGARTTDILNHKQASELITKHGVEGLYGKLMSKKFNFSPSETVAAEMLIKHYGTTGGEANLSKALDLVAKTGKGGREMGQAIQALHMFNKLDESGVLMLGTKQLNKGVEDISKYKTLTTEQAKPLTAAAQRYGTADQTKNLADEVLSIVTNKQAGEALTDAEKATIKQFQDQVKLINEKGKGILPEQKGAKGNATIKEVSQIEPQARTRDQVVSFLDAKAEQARQRIAASRNIGFAAVNKGNPVADYAIIGASHIAKGVVKLSDFTEQMVKDFGASIKPHIDEVFTKATNIFRKENGLPTVQELDRVVNKAVKDERFSPEDATRFKAWASEIGHYADHNLKTEAIQDLQMAMKDLGDSTLGQKIATVQTGDMLLNAVTMERNVLGNAAQLIGDKAAKVVTVPIDWAVSKLTGEQRTIVFNQMNQEKFWKNFMEGTKAGWKGVSPNGQLDSYGVHPNVFGKNNPLKYVTKLLGASLQGFDHAFYSTAKGEVLATYAEQLGKAQGMSRTEIKAGMKDLIVKLDDRINELADHAGKYATYQDETMLSKGAEMLKKGLNAPTDMISRKLVDAGMPQKYSLEGFGAGDVLLKFAKTPANLVMRGIDYSPIGFIRSIMDLGTFALNREKFNQHEAVRSLGRAITGTLGFTGMGYILADAGILTGSASMDKDVRSIQEQSGQGAYKVNWSALSRFFQSGFNYDAAHYQKGDRLMDYQWLQPAAISVAMGVNANKAVKAKKAGDMTAGWQMAGKALLGGIQTVLENPMVQGLTSVIDAGTDIIKKQDPTKLYNIAKGVPASFVPTLLNQARQSTDNNQRETFNKSLLTEIGNIMANKVPGLSKNLPISYDSMGNAREKLQGGQENTVAQYLTSFFSPAKMTEYKVSPEAKLVLDLMNQSGNATILPRIADKSFHVTQGKNIKDLKVDLTSEQFSQLQQETGKMVTEKLSLKADVLSNPNVSLQHKVDVVKQILTDVGSKARVNVGTQMGYKKTAIKS